MLIGLTLFSTIYTNCNQGRRRIFKGGDGGIDCTPIWATNLGYICNREDITEVLYGSWQNCCETGMCRKGNSTVIDVWMQECFNSGWYCNCSFHRLCNQYNHAKYCQKSSSICVVCTTTDWLPTGLQPDCLHGLRTSLRYVLVHPLSFF